MSDTDKPMPCPFCGCNKIDRYLPLHRDEPQYSCAETTCAAHALHTSLKRWNTRASAEQPKGISAHFGDGPCDDPECCKPSAEQPDLAAENLLLREALHDVERIVARLFAVKENIS